MSKQFKVGDRVVFAGCDESADGRSSTWINIPMPKRVSATWVR